MKFVDYIIGKLILCFVKHLPVADAQRVFDLVLERGDFGVL
jgi:hypothetical protein